MESAYSQNETVQSQIGEFEYLYVNGEEIGAAVIDLDSRVTTLEGAGGFDSSSLEDSITLLSNRVSTLEGASFDPSIVDNLSTQLQALQTRTGTLESLIALFTNNNQNDTHLEHRISTLEKQITALKALYDAKRAVYNMPLDW